VKRLEGDDYPNESNALEAVVFDWGQARILKLLVSGWGIIHRFGFFSSPKIRPNWADFFAIIASAAVLTYRTAFSS
jgi:hypothetical protein